MNEFAWIVVACTILSGYFALASVALRTFGRAAIEDAFGGKESRRFELFERHLTALRLTAALGRSLSNLVLAVAMVYLLGGSHDWVQAVWAIVAAAAIVAIFGVAVPSAWASYGGEKVIARTFWGLMAFRTALWPIVAAMQAVEKPMRRLSGVSDQAVGPQEAAKQEILLAATEGRAEGTVAPEEAKMIERVMEFGHRRAGEIMTPRTDIFALPATTPWLEACRKVSDGGHSRVPVYEGDIDNITGILYAKDLLRPADGNPPNLQRLQRKPFFVPQTKLLGDLLREFKARKVHLAVVLDEYGGTAGMVTIEDVLEEIVGEIADEFDQAEPALMKRIDDRTAEVDGRMYIDDLNDAMGLSIPEDEDYDTIAGYVFSELGYIPTAGETLQVAGCGLPGYGSGLRRDERVAGSAQTAAVKITVLAADARKITRLKIEKRPADAPEE